MSKIIIASGPVIVESNKVILNQHGDTKFWKFCGGQRKERESLMETAIRRAKEEIGITIKILNPTPFLFHTIKEIKDEKVDVILVHYLAKRIGRIKLGQDIRKSEWILLEDLKKENLAPNILPTLKHFGFMK